MGRQKMPIEMKQQRGTYRKDRDGVPLKIKNGAPSIPKWLSKKARPHWKLVVGLFADANVLTKLDQISLGLLCDAVGHYIQFRDDAAANGWTATSNTGGSYQHPSVGMMNKAFERIIKLAMHFGMSPVARAKLAMGNKEAENDPMTDLLKKISEKRNMN